MTAHTLTARRWVSWAKDAGERAAKTAFQAVALIALGEVAELTSVVAESPDEYLPGYLVYLMPVIMAGLSFATSFLSKFTGSKASASLID